MEDNQNRDNLNNGYSNSQTEQGNNNYYFEQNQNNGYGNGQNGNGQYGNGQNGNGQYGNGYGNGQNGNGQYGNGYGNGQNGNGQYGNGYGNGQNGNGQYGNNQFGNPSGMTPVNNYEMENPNEKKGLGIAAVIVGIVSLLCCCSGISFPLPIIGLIMSIVCVVKGKGSGKTLGIVGIILNGLALIVCFIMLAVIVSAIDWNAITSDYINEFSKIDPNDSEAVREWVNGLLKPQYRNY